MSGHHRFEALRARMNPERRARNAAKTQELLAAMPRHELRQASAQSQADLAQRLKVKQPASAKMEHPVEAAHTAESTRARKEHAGAEFVQKKMVRKR